VFTYRAVLCTDGMGILACLLDLPHRYINLLSIPSANADERTPENGGIAEPGKVEF
jgi:hypothetical protein